MLRFVRSSAALIGRLVPGLVLTGASASKVFAFHPFAGSLSHLAFMPPWLATPAAVVVVALECATGLLLLAGKFTRIAAPAALVLFVGFTLVLSAAIMRGVDLPCNCFGSLGPQLPIRAQSVLDLILAAVVVMFLHEDGGAARRVKRLFAYPRIAGIAGLIWGFALILWPGPVPGRAGETPIPAPRVREDPPGSPRRPAVIMLADFDDFGCQLCLDDFLAFCDSLNGERYRQAVSVRLVARRDSTRTVFAQARMLEGWAAGNGFLFPVSLDSERVFEQSGVGKTSAILLGQDGRLIEIAHFPTGRGRRSELLRAILD